MVFIIRASFAISPHPRIIVDQNPQVDPSAVRTLLHAEAALAILLLRLTEVNISSPEVHQLSMSVCHRSRACWPADIYNRRLLGVVMAGPLCDQCDQFSSKVLGLLLLFLCCSCPWLPYRRCIRIESLRHYVLAILNTTVTAHHIQCRPTLYICSIILSSLSVVNNTTSLYHDHAQSLEKNPLLTLAE